MELLLISCSSPDAQAQTWLSVAHPHMICRSRMAAVRSLRASSQVPTDSDVLVRCQNSVCRDGGCLYVGHLPEPAVGRVFPSLDLNAIPHDNCLLHATCLVQGADDYFQPTGRPVGGQTSRRSATAYRPLAG